MCGLKSSLLCEPPFSAWTSREVSCRAYLVAGPLISLPSIVDLQRLAGVGQRTGEPREHTDCSAHSGGVCAIVEELIKPFINSSVTQFPQ